MKSLKNNITLIFLFFSIMCKAQTVTDFIRMIDTQFTPYQDGEFLANDSLTDIKNGYYQRGFYQKDFQNKDEQKLLRQVAVFTNNDGTKTILEAVSSYNFVCWSNEIKIYDYDGQSLSSQDTKNYFVPTINDEAFLPEQTISVFKKVFEHSGNKNDLTLQDLISNAYDNVRYKLPRYGTTITVYLDYCDHFGEDLVISEKDWNTIKKGTVPLKFLYDKKRKQFVR